MKSPATLLRELRAELRYWQGHYRMGIKSLARTGEKINEIAAEMRKLQKEIKDKKSK